MKRIIALVLFPLTIILLLFKKMWEVVEALAESIEYGVNEIIEMNYNFWAKIFKWKESE